MTAEIEAAMPATSARRHRPCGEGTWVGGTGVSIEIDGSSSDSGGVASPRNIQVPTGSTASAPLPVPRDGVAIGAGETIGPRPCSVGARSGSTTRDGVGGGVSPPTCSSARSGNRSRMK